MSHRSIFSRFYVESRQFAIFVNFIHPKYTYFRTYENCFTTVFDACRVCFVNIHTRIKHRFDNFLSAIYQDEQFPFFLSLSLSLSMCFLLFFIIWYSSHFLFRALSLKLPSFNRSSTESGYVCIFVYKTSLYLFNNLYNTALMSYVFWKTLHTYRSWTNVEENSFH